MCKSQEWTFFCDRRVWLDIVRNLWFGWWRDRTQSLDISHYQCLGVSIRDAGFGIHSLECSTGEC